MSLSTAITAILFNWWWRPFQFDVWLCYDKNYRMIFYPIINLFPSCSSQRLFSAPCDFYTPYLWNSLILHQRGGKKPIAGYTCLTAFLSRASPLAMTRWLMMRQIIAGGWRVGLCRAKKRTGGSDFRAISWSWSRCWRLWLFLEYHDIGDW